METAILYYLIAAEMGYVTAQANLAWLLERYGPYSLAPGESLDELVLTYWVRAGNQGSWEARLRSGDYYFYGKGTQQNLNKAASLYEAAAVNDRSSMAMWNLGYMFENGLGVKRDFPLAKRWYDLASVRNPDAYLAVLVSNVKLALRYIYAWITLDKELDASPAFFFPPSAPATSDVEAGSSVQQQTHSPEDDDWSIGKNGENLKKWTKKDQQQPEEKAATEQAYADEILEEGVLDNFVILTLCALVGWMVYVRQFRAPDQPQQRPMEPYYDDALPEEEREE
jgi:SEL1 protein